MGEKKQSVFSERLTILIDESGKTQRKLSKEMKLSLGGLNGWKTGEKIPRANNVRRIAEYFKVSPEWLFGTTDIRSITPNMRAKAESIGVSEKAFKRLEDKKYFTDKERATFSKLIETGEMKKIIDGFTALQNPELDDERYDMFEFLLWKEFLKIAQNQRVKA